MSRARTLANGSYIADNAITLDQMAHLGTDGHVLTSTGTGSAPAFEAISVAVLQVLSTTTTAASSAYSDIDTWGDIPGMTIAITPASSSNKILLSFSISLGYTTQLSAAVKMVRGSTDIGVGDAGGSRHRTWVSQRCIDGQSYNNVPFNGQYLDSPSTSSEETYKLQWLLPEGSTTVYLNRSLSFADNADISTTASTITVMEVAG